jgi:hypothetical protein
MDFLGSDLLFIDSRKRFVTGAGADLLFEQLSSYWKTLNSPTAG